METLILVFHKMLFAMKTNMGKMDRMIRLFIAAVCIALYANNAVSNTGGIILLCLTVVLVLTSLLSYCPLYSLLGISTCPKKA